MSSANAPFGLGVAWIDQALPFQTSANGTKPVPPFELPTASQAVEDVHDTPFRKLLAAPLGFGVVSSVHALPFQPSAIVVVPPASESYPTAVQTVGDGHDTELSELLVLPAGFGLDCTAHAAPFHISTNVNVVVPVESKYDPTAVQADDDVHETPLRPAPLAPPGNGTVWRLHVVPFQASANGLLLPEIPDVPTASHEVDDAQDTPASWS
jgi:hypothetical protein